MKWTDFLGAEKQKNWFANALRNERLGSSFLLVGPEGVGKRTFARLLAKTVFCERVSPKEFAPCGSCEQCVQIEANTHPDLLTLSKPEGKSDLPLELLVGPRENRMREGLLYDLSLKPFYGKRRVAIIDDADYLNEEGANSLLKTLEEPPPGALIFLVSTSKQRQLPTIRSRCQVVSFPSLQPDDLSKLLKRNFGSLTPADLESVVSTAFGTTVSLEHLQDESLAEFRIQLLEQLVEIPFPIVSMSKAMMGCVDQVGTDGSLKRERLHLLFKYVLDFYRAVIRSSGARGLDQRVQVCIDKIRSRLMNSAGTANQIVARTLDAKEQIDRNIALAAVVESWCVDVATLLDG